MKSFLGESDPKQMFPLKVGVQSLLFDMNIAVKYALGFSAYLEATKQLEAP